MTNEVRELFELVASGGRSVLYDYGGSRAASTTTTTPMVTEIINGLIVTRPAKKNEPEITILNDSWESKAASVQVNEVAELFNTHFGFLNGKLE